MRSSILKMLVLLLGFCYGSVLQAQYLTVSHSELTQLWSSTKQAIEAGDYYQAERQAKELLDLGKAAGFTSMESLATFAAARALHEVKAGNLEAASRLEVLSKELAPGSLNLAVSYFNLNQRLNGVSFAIAELWSATLNNIAKVRVVLLLIKSLAYPLLWVFTFALLVLQLLTICLHYEQLLRRFALILPIAVRALVAPIALVVILAVPVFLGPIFTLLLWSLMLLALLPGSKNLAIWPALCVTLWAIMIPVRQHLVKSLAKPELLAVLNLANHDFAPQYRTSLEAAMNVKNLAGPAYFIEGKLLSTEENYEEAAIALNQSSEHLGKRDWLKLESAKVALLRDDKQKARADLEALYKSGVRSAELLYNLSLVRFSDMDLSASSALLAEARQADPDLIDYLESSREKNPETTVYASSQLPDSALYTAVFKSVEIKASEYDLVASKLLRGANLLIIAVLGIGLLIAGTLAKPLHKDRALVYYKNYKAGRLGRLLSWVPGASAVRQRKFGWALSVISVCFLVSIPILGWPADLSSLKVVFAGIAPIYLSCVSLLILALGYVSASSYREVR